MLKFTYSSAAEIPEAHKDLYAERDGKFVLQVEGAVPSDKLKEFRDENVRLKQDLEKFKDVDPAKYAEALAKAKQVDDGKFVKAEGFEEAVNKRVSETKAASEKAVVEAKKEAEDAKAALHKQQMALTIRDAGLKFGVRKEALADLELRGQMQLKMIDGKLVACDPVSGQQMYDEDAQPMSAEKWVAKLTKDAPHLFEPNSGAGGQGGAGAGGFTGVNPWASKSTNLTEQARILKENPALAQRLKTAAGI